MLAITSKARCALTDSGTFKKKYRLGDSLSDAQGNMKRPIAVDQGTNQLLCTDREMIHAAIHCILCDEGKGGNIPVFWDGHASERIVQDLCQWLQVRESAPRKYQD